MSKNAMTSVFRLLQRAGNPIVQQRALLLSARSLANARGVRSSCTGYESRLHPRSFSVAAAAESAPQGAIHVEPAIAEEWGNVHSYESMSCVDGPGMRSIVFLQGCTKRCLFCANPDTIKTSGGTHTSSKDVADKLARAAPYLKKGDVCGGVTLSGGEPSIQPSFVAAIFKEAHALGLTTCIDTSGAGTTDGWDLFLPHTDYALVCIKSTDKATYNHITQTQESGRVVLRFIEELEKRSIPFWIRHVLMTGLTDSEKELTHVAELATSHSACRGVELLPYHRLGLHKYKELGWRYPLGDMQPPNREATQAAKATLEKAGATVLL